MSSSSNARERFSSRRRPRTPKFPGPRRARTPKFPGRALAWLPSAMSSLPRVGMVSCPCSLRFIVSAGPPVPLPMLPSRPIRVVTSPCWRSATRRGTPPVRQWPVAAVIRRPGILTWCGAGPMAIGAATVVVPTTSLRLAPFRLTPLHRSTACAALPVVARGGCLHRCCRRRYAWGDYSLVRAPPAESARSSLSRAQSTAAAVCNWCCPG
mmetsp:Transcript_1941/g.5734  ORF Transcript_1941/g.5734 Transcript_1941/m.5734 type:complete len:210 (-) Transcript_1941:454-1083(-)